MGYVRVKSGQRSWFKLVGTHCCGEWCRTADDFPFKCPLSSGISQPAMFDETGECLSSYTYIYRYAHMYIDINK